MRSIVVLVFLASAAVYGCTSPCQNLKNASDHLNTVSAPCAGDAGTFTTFDLNSCNNAIGKCSSADDTALNKEASCLDSVGTCDPNNELAWLGSVAACNQTLSSACQNSGVTGDTDGGS